MAPRGAHNFLLAARASGEWPAALLEARSRVYEAIQRAGEKAGAVDAPDSVTEGLLLARGAGGLGALFPAGGEGGEVGVPVALEQD